MYIPMSSAPAARQWLFDQLTATLTPDPDDKSASLLVCFDDPGPNQPADIVSVGKITRRLSTNSFVGDGGAGYLEESYTIEIVVEVFRGGDDSQVAYTRAAYLAAAVFAVVRTDLSLGGSVVRGRPLSDLTESAWDENHSGTLATATLEIDCYQRI